MGKQILKFSERMNAEQLKKKMKILARKKVHEENCL